jgi:hypothetical protein
MSSPTETRADRIESPAPSPAPSRPAPGIEKFTVAELTALHNELVRGLDSWQAADVATNFLTGHGYGVSTDELRRAIARMESARCSIDCLQAELERVAFIQ